MPSSEPKPPRRSRTARFFGWCWRHKLRATLLLLVLIPLLPVLLIIVLVVLGNGITKVVGWWSAHGYHSDIEVEGQLLDYDTKQPLADVLVAVLVRGHGPNKPTSWFYFPFNPHGGGGGGRPSCMDASAVVRTDAKGRYRYRTTFVDATRGGRYAQVDTTIRPYKYGYEAVHADDGTPDYELYRFDDRTTISPRPPYQDAARAMAMRKIPVDGDRDLRIKNSIDLYCRVTPSDRTYRSWVARAAAVSEDGWREWCTPGGEWTEDRSFATYLIVERFENTLGVVHGYRFPETDDGYRRLALERKSKDSPFQYALDFLENPQMHDYPFRKCWADRLACVDFTPVQKQTYCDYLRSRHRRLLQWEYQQ